MSRNAPDAQCTLSTAGAVTTVPIGIKRSVVYEFNTNATKPNLALPYAVAIDGKVLPAYADKPRALGENRKVSLLVDPGSRVALYLNSDVHPDHRRHPVYAVEVGGNDVLVKVTERKGRISHERSVLRAPYCRASDTPGKRVDVYEAALTGDIWMEVSHRYTAGEAGALLPADTPAAIRDGVRSIYDVLPSPELVVKFPASDSAPKLALRLRFQESENVRQNITHCPLLSEVLPRTHPRAFAALLAEARAAAVGEVLVTSCWRPMFGSIGHRAGLGLDISYIEGAGQQVFINRTALTRANGMRTGSVSEREKALYGEYLQAKEQTQRTASGLESAKARLAHNHDPGEASRLQKIVSAAEAHTRENAKIEAEAAQRWNDERDQNEPGLIQTLREKLGKNPSVRQLFDPWYLDGDTHDDTGPVPNLQRSSNEKTHDNHLHLTILEPGIL